MDPSPSTSPKILKSHVAVRTYLLDAISKTIPPGSSLLHINCGAGEVTYLLYSRGFISTSLGIDPVDNANGGRFPFLKVDTSTLPTDQLPIYDVVLIDNSAGNLSQNRAEELLRWAVHTSYCVYVIDDLKNEIYVGSSNIKNLLSYEYDGRQLALTALQLERPYIVKGFYRTNIHGGLIPVESPTEAPPEKGARTHALFTKMEDRDGKDIWAKRYFGNVRPPMMEMAIYQWLSKQENIDFQAPESYDCVYGFTFPFDPALFGDTGMPPEAYHGPGRDNLHRLAQTVVEHDVLPKVPLYELAPFTVVPTDDGPRLFRFTPRDSYNTGQTRASKAKKMTLGQEEKPRLLWVGDAGVNTGLAKVSREFLRRLSENHGWDVVQLATNYDGDPHEEPYKIYPAQRARDVVPGIKQDWAGVRRLEDICKRHKPHITVINLDPWNVLPYVQAASTWWETRVPMMVSYIAVDSLNVRRDIAAVLNGIDVNIFYTQFGVDQAKLAGFTGEHRIIYHGVDRSLYKPMDRNEARQLLGMSSVAGAGDFVFGCVARNQPRKRLDLTVRTFAQWVKDNDIPPTVKLYLHTQQLDKGYDLGQLTKYYGIATNRVILPTGTDLLKDFAEDMMPYVYNSMDVHINNASAEGFCLPVLESMACGIPQIVPDFSALGEWPGDAVHKVPIAYYDTTPEGINTIHGVVSEQGMVEAFDTYYRNPEYRREMGQKALEKACEEDFDWDNLAAQMNDALMSQLERKVKIATN